MKHSNRANVTIQVQDINQAIGVFGHYNELIIEFNEPIVEVKNIWGQDLLSQEAIDITPEVKIEDKGTS